MLSQPARGRIAIMTRASRRQGIGTAVCRALAQNEVDIFFAHWCPYDQRMTWSAEEDEPNNLQQQVRALGVRCEHLSIDLAAIDASARILQAVQDRLGLASILVNNAVHNATTAPFDRLDAPTLDA